MPDYLSQGVFIEERNVGARPISGVATANLGIIGIFAKGSNSSFVPFGSYEEFVTKLGDLILNSESAYAVKAFFANGGASGYAARAIYAADAAMASYQMAATLGIGAVVRGDLKVTNGIVSLTAATANLKITVDGNVKDNLDVTAGGGTGNYSLSIIATNINTALSLAYPNANLGSVASVASGYNTVTAQVVGTTLGSVKTVTGTLLTLPAIPAEGSPTGGYAISISEPGGQVAKDDGSGNLVGAAVTSGFINYATGAFQVVFVNNTTVGNITATYRTEVAGTSSLKISSPTTGVSSNVTIASAANNDGLAAIFGTTDTDTGVDPSATKTFKYVATSFGAWGNGLTVYHAVNKDQASRVDLTVALNGVIVEFYEAISFWKSNADESFYYKTVIESSSQYLTVTEDAGWTSGNGLPGGALTVSLPLAGGLERLSEGTSPTRAADMKVAFSSAINQLNTVDEMLNIIVPDAETLGASDCSFIQKLAADYYINPERHTDTFAILGTPYDKDNSDANTVANYLLNVASIGHSYAAMYYPAVNIFDELRRKNRRTSNSGHVAGVYARTDSTRNVGKAPGGITDGALYGITSVFKRLSKNDRDILYQRRINPLISSADTGNAVWGVRTTSLDPAWRYIQTRRLFIYMERSVYRALFWVVDENNGPDLWLQSSLQINGFCYNKFKDGYFAGATPDEAYKVVADVTNNPQSAIDSGLFTLDVYIAGNKPAEFVRVRFQKMVKTA